jgi:hypothetical protein
MPGSDKPHRKSPPVYVRFDLNVSGDGAAAVVRAIPLEEMGERQAERTNDAKPGKQCTCRVQATRNVEGPES